MCQIYKYHYREDIFLDTDFLPRLFLPPFIMRGSPGTMFTWLGFRSWAIYLPRLCFWRTKQLLYFFCKFWSVNISKYSYPASEGRTRGNISDSSLFLLPPSLWSATYLWRCMVFVARQRSAQKLASLHSLQDLSCQDLYSIIANGQSEATGLSSVARDLRAFHYS